MFFKSFYQTRNVSLLMYCTSPCGRRGMIFIEIPQKKIITWEKGLGGRGARGCVRTTSSPQRQFGQILYPWFSFEFSGPQPKNWLLCSHYTGRPGLLLEHGGSYRWWLWARCCHHCKGRHSYFSHCPLVTCIMYLSCVVRLPVRLETWLTALDILYLQSFWW